MSEPSTSDVIQDFFDACSSGGEKLFVSEACAEWNLNQLLSLNVIRRDKTKKTPVMN
jgi:hypothetical protein